MSKRLKTRRGGRNGSAPGAGAEDEEEDAIAMESEAEKRAIAMVKWSELLTEVRRQPCGGGGR